MELGRWFGQLDHPTFPSHLFLHKSDMFTGVRQIATVVDYCLIASLILTLWILSPTSRTDRLAIGFQYSVARSNTDISNLEV